MRNSIVYIILLLIGSLQAQIVVTGKILDTKTALPVPGIVIFSKQNNVAVETDEEGSFTMTLEKPDTIRTVNSDYHQYIKYVDASQTIQVSLEEEVTELQEVVIVGEKDDRLDNTQMSVNEYTRDQIKEIPAIFGEPDVLKVIQLKPGIQINGEGANSIVVRGGGPDQNLVLIDKSIVYNPTHLFGFFSVFNSDIINNVKVYKGDFPAYYGGRLSSVIDVTTKSPCKDSVTGSGGIGLISSRFNIDIPIVKGKTALFLGARRTYFDVLTNALNKANEDNPGWEYIPNYHFQDFNAKIEHDIGKKDKIFINGFLSRDKLLMKRNNFKFFLNWGNIASTLKWNHVFNSKLLMSNSLVYSDYNYKAGSAFSSFNFEVGAKIQELGFKSQIEYEKDSKSSFTAGFESKKYIMDLGRLNGGSDSIKLDLSIPAQFTDAALYGSWAYKPNVRWRFESGLRINYVNNTGLNFVGIEPRLTAAYRYTNRCTFKASFSRVYQNIHLIANSGSSLPIDYWYPSTKKILPQYANQLAAGVSMDLGKNFFFSYEIFYKQLRRQVDFRNNADLYFNKEIENDMIIGKGWAYGGEFYLEKKKGKLTGWIGYTLAWSKRQFDEINLGEPFFARNDRRHDISFVTSYKLNNRLSFSSSWVFSSGVVTTLPMGKFVFQGFDNEPISLAPDYGRVNNYRIPAYHRLDLGMVYKFFRKWGESDLTFSLYNTYGRRNTYFIAFEPEKSEIPVAALQKLKALSVSLFSLIPSITYNFRF